MGYRVLENLHRDCSQYWRGLSLALVACGPAVAAVIEGVVVEGRLGRPLARTQVVLEAAAGAQRTVTDHLGRFTFPDLPAGVYYLSASRPGFATTRLGQRRWNGPGTPIVLEPDSRFVAELRLAKLGVISGEVTDENGVGLPDQQVLVYRRGPPLELVGQGRTDDRGVYRVAGLEPGFYHVRTAPIQLEDGTDLLPTYFPRTASPEESVAVEVRLDSETSSVNITPLAGKLFRVTGTVGWPGVRSVALYSDLGRRDAGVDANGGFVFDQLPPGNYELLAASAEGGRHLVAYRIFWLSGDIEGMHLEPAPAPTVSVLCEDRRGRRVDVGQVMLFLRRKQPPSDGGAHRLTCQAREALTPGIWESAVLTPPEQYVAEMAGERGKLEHGQFPLAAGQSLALRVVLADTPAALRGTVVSKEGRPVAGATVLLKPLESDGGWRVRGRNSARTDMEGNYRLDGLPPGTYQVLASLEYRTPEEADWETLPSQTVTLRESDRVVLDLKLSGN
jgi:protocatechuate 3,4-dioxygenase beta subunit